MKINKLNKGFTLFELLVTIFVISGAFVVGYVIYLIVRFLQTLS